MKQKGRSLVRRNKRPPMFGCFGFGLPRVRRPTAVVWVIGTRPHGPLATAIRPDNPPQIATADVGQSIALSYISNQLTTDQ